MSLFIKIIRYLTKFAYKQEIADSAFIDYLQRNPNPKLTLFVEYWRGKEITIRGAAKRLMVERPEAGFELDKLGM